MLWVVEETKKEQKIYPTLQLKKSDLKFFKSDLTFKILRELAESESSPIEIARRLGEKEQKIYYHFRKLEKIGIIEVVRKEERVGTVAKIYRLKFPYISFKIFDGNFLKEKKIRVKELKALKPFIENGKLNSLIVIGSPDPHGKYLAQASDGSAAIDLALYLGSFLKETKLCYKLDTQVKQNELKENLILIGGPKANMILERINEKLPIYFDVENDFNLVSTLSKKVYNQDEVGIIIKVKNPFNPNKKILVLSGKRFKGTRASIIGFIKYSKEFEDEEFARVVLGVDKDSDGIIDDVIFLE